MSAAPKNRSRITDFIQKLFAESQSSQELLRKLCDAGCDKDDLARLLYAVSTFAVPAVRRLLPKEPSTVDVRRLAIDLRSLADRVEPLNRTPLNPKLDLLCAPPDTKRDPLRKHMAHLYEILPGVMRVYSSHLETFAKVSRKLRKRRTFLHNEVLRLLLYVKERTGRPRYGELSELLNAARTKNLGLTSRS